MTALEALYNNFKAPDKINNFYKAFRDDCPRTFFKGLDDLCCVHEDGSLDLCCKCWLQEMVVDIHSDEIFLLSTDEYKKYVDVIPEIEAWWWTRTPGAHESKAVSVHRNGTVDTIGEYVKYGWVAVRPALTITHDIFAKLKVGDRYVKYDFPWIKIDDTLAIAEVPIGFVRFDVESNDYEESEVRQYLINWLKQRMEHVE